MTDQEFHDLLIRLDERTKNMEEGLNEKMSGMNCYTNTTKIKTLEKITWGVVIVLLGLATKTVWATLLK